MDSSPIYSTAGTAAYLPSCTSRIREALPDFPLEPVILQSIFLCLVARDSNGTGEGESQRKNLILRTRDEDVGLVLTLAHMTLTKVFGISANKCKIKGDSGHSSRHTKHKVSDVPEHPDDLVRRCFLRGKAGSRWSTGTDKAHREKPKRAGSVHGPRRSSTFPSASPASSEVPLPFVNLSTHTRESTAESVQDVTSLGSSRRLSAATLRLRPKAPRMESEPSMLPTVHANLSINHDHIAPLSSTIGATSGSLPKALVMSGLEHAAIPAQRGLLQVLQERRIVLHDHQSDAPGVHSINKTDPTNIWKLPPDFFTIYVCPFNAQERPPIMCTLLDKFAMSADVTITTPIRQAYLAYRSSLNTPLSSSAQSLSPRAPLSPLFSQESIPLAPSPRLRASPLQQVVSSSSPVITTEEIDYLRSLTAPVPPCLLDTYNTDQIRDAYTSIYPTLQLYLLDLFSAARHHPLMDGTMLTLRAHQDAEDLVRAYRVVCGDTVGADLITSVAATVTANGYARSSQDSGTDDDLVSPTDEQSDIGWGDSLGEEQWLGAELQAGKKKASSIRSLEVKIQSPDTPTRNALFDSQSEVNIPPLVAKQPQIWDVSEVDIARIFPRIVSHRLRIRRGPDDEILGSVMFPAVRRGTDLEDSGVEPYGPDKSVKQVIISILADV